MSIRNKLILMLALPLAALAVVGAIGFRSQSSAALAASEARAQDSMVQSLNRVIKAIGGERLAGAESENSVLSPVVERRVATDVAMAEAMSIAQRLGLEETQLVVQEATDTMAIVRATGNLLRVAPVTESLRAARDDVFVDYPTQDSFALATSVDIAVDIADRQDSIWIEYITRLSDTNVDLARRLRAEIGATELLREQIVDIAPADHAASITADLASRIDKNIERAGIDAINLFDRGDGNLLDTPTLAIVVASHDQWHSHAISLQEAVETRLADLTDEANSRQNLYALSSILGLLVLFGLIYTVYRSVVRPLDDLLVGAEQVATKRLPSVVAELRTMGSSDTNVRIEPLRSESNDELGSLVDAFNDVQLTAFDLAVEQARSRRNIAEMFVNLGRRNQKLLQRMLGVISELEHDEKNADRLEQLFHLDHMTTRMRRNAESLLVVAGTTTPRQWAKPVPAADVVRSALAEVQDYHRIDILNLADAPMAGNAVADVTHLVAELLENSLQFSDPESRVTVSSRWKDGDYRIVITDEGFGMTSEELAENNRLIASPPPPDQAPTRFLGLFVVGHLASRHGIEVVLADGTMEGTDVRITIPGSVMSEAKTAEIERSNLPIRGTDLDAELAQLTAESNALREAEVATELAAQAETDAPAGDLPVRSETFRAETDMPAGDLPVRSETFRAETDAPAGDLPVRSEAFRAETDAPAGDLPVRSEAFRAETDMPAGDLPVRSEAFRAETDMPAGDLPVRSETFRSEVEELPVRAETFQTQTDAHFDELVRAESGVASGDLLAQNDAVVAAGDRPVSSEMAIDFGEVPKLPKLDHAYVEPVHDELPPPPADPLLESPVVASPPAADLGSAGLPQRTPRATLDTNAIPAATPTSAAPVNAGEPEDVSASATHVGSVFSAFQAGVQRGERSSN